MTKPILKSSIVTVTILLVIVLFFVLVYQRNPIKPNGNNGGTEIVIPRVSAEDRKSLEALVTYVSQRPLIATNKEKNTFVILYKKASNESPTNYVAIVLGGGKEKNFRLATDMKVPINASGGFSDTRFIDFNNDGLEDVYIGAYADLASTERDDFVLIQNKLGEFVLAGREPENLFRYTSAPGVGPKFEDVDGDGSIEILIGNVQGYLTENPTIITRIIKFRDGKFFLWKEKPYTDPNP